jgi:hypothetical protein
VFLYFDEIYTQTQLTKNEQITEVDFDDRCYEEVVKAFQEKQITPHIITFRFVPDQEILFLPQKLNLSNACREEVEVLSIPLLIYDEMLPVL